MAALVDHVAGGDLPDLKDQGIVSLLPPLDFLTDPGVFRVVAEGERLAYAHLFNPAFATEISMIDPLPHQWIAVYDHMLPRLRLRFLLGDEPGAGKTIMAGPYIREMLARRLLIGCESINSRYTEVGCREPACWEGGSEGLFG